MMTRGAKPRLDILKVDQRERTGASDSVAASADSMDLVPEPPSHLSDEAKKKWPQICEELVELKTLRATDLNLVEMYCESWATWKVSVAKLREQGQVLMNDKGNFY